LMTFLRYFIEKKSCYTESETTEEKDFDHQSQMDSL